MQLKVGDLVRKRPDRHGHREGRTGIVIETADWNGGTVIKVAWSHDYGSFCYPSRTKALELISESR